MLATSSAAFRSPAGVRPASSKHQNAPVSVARALVRPTRTACASVAGAQAAEPESDGAGVFQLLGKRICVFITAVLTAVLANCGGALAAATASPVLTGGAWMQHALTQARNTFVQACQQMTAPQILGTLLCASFACSLLLITNSHDEQLSVGTVYAVPEGQASHYSPWEPVGAVGRRSTPVYEHPGMESQPPKVTAERAAFAAKALPFIAAASAGSVLKGFDALWGPALRDTRTGNPRTAFSVKGATVASTTEPQEDKPTAPTAHNQFADEEQAMWWPAGPQGAEAPDPTPGIAAQPSYPQKQAPIHTSASRAPAAKPEVQAVKFKTAAPPASKGAAAAKATAAPPKTTIQRTTMTVPIEHVSTAAPPKATAAAPAAKAAGSNLDAALKAAAAADTQPAPPATGQSRPGARSRATPVAPAPATAARRVLRARTRSPLPNISLPSQAQVQQTLASAQNAAATMSAISAGLFLPLVNSPRQPMTFATPQARLKADPLAHLSAISAPTAKPTWDPLAQLLQAQPPLHATHGAAWDPLHHVRSITAPTRATHARSIFDPLSHVSYATAPTAGAAWDPLRRVLKAQAPTRKTVQPSIFDPLSRMAYVTPNGPGPGGAPMDPLNRVLRAAPPTRANVGKTIFDPLSHISAVSAPKGGERWDPLKRLVAMEAPPQEERQRGVVRTAVAWSPPRGGATWDPVKVLTAARAPQGKSMLDPMHALRTMQAPSDKPSWDPVQAVSKLSRSSFRTKLPSLPNAPKLSLPNSGPQWNPLRIFRRGKLGGAAANNGSSAGEEVTVVVAPVDTESLSTEVPVPPVTKQKSS